MKVCYTIEIDDSNTEWMKLPEEERMRWDWIKRREALRLLRVEVQAELGMDPKKNTILCFELGKPDPELEATLDRYYKSKEQSPSS